jgi:flagellar biosynthesis protein FlhB
MALHAIALLSFLYLVPLVPPQYAYLAISFAMKAIAVASALRVYYAFGLPQMSLDSVKAYFANAFSSNDFFHLIFILFCHMATPIFPFALWTGIVGASVSLAYVNTKFSNHPLAMKLRQPPLNAGLQVIPTLGEQVEMYLAWVELLMVFVSAVYLFTPARYVLFSGIDLNIISICLTIVVFFVIQQLINLHLHDHSILAYALPRFASSSPSVRPAPCSH